MRQGYEGTLWKDESGAVIGVNLGSDFCAEHEWGISGINTAFGITPTKTTLCGLVTKPKLGIASRTITKGADQVEKVELIVTQWSKDKAISRIPKKLFGVAQKSSWRVTQDYSWLTKSSSWDPTKDEVLGFWAESRFLFLVEHESIADAIAEAFKNNDIAIWTGGSGPFKNGGLVIAIASRLPKDFIEKMQATDQDSLDLNVAAERTGIADILKSAKKEYYALSPSWKDDTKQEVIFWLNPQNQDIHNYGWYDVDTLKQWSRGEGPILKANDEKKASK